MKKCFLITLFFNALIAICLSETPIQVASKRYPIPYKNDVLQFPYESSHDLFTKNASVKQALFLVHSASYSAKQYYLNGRAMLEKVPAEENITLIIAPHFLKSKHVQEASNPNFLYWRATPFWGSSRGFFNNKDICISAYEVVDVILSNLVKNNNFPNLKKIVIIGHSAGGQMVNRYAACNLFESQVAFPNNIDVKYVVTAPSSYLYFSKERPVKGSLSKFALPDNANTDYNRWAYGLDSLYSYHTRNHIKANWIIEHYPQKNILYLVGSNDKDSEDSSLDKSTGAMLQGSNRLVRARLYYNYLKHFFGNEIKKHQKFYIVKNMGHWGQGLMASPACLKFVFEQNMKGK
ncbi:MAG: hypothetical protein ACYSO4_00200 [Planctomycetota bacterium]|jgi:hypothetical protein